MKNKVLLFLLLTFGCRLHAEPKEFRTWNSLAGTTLEARFVAEKQGFIRLEKEDGSLLTVKLDQLVDADHVYVEQATEVRGATRVEGISAAPGSFSGKISCEADNQWHYYLYLPNDFHTGRDWPVWFIMSPGGGGKPGPLNRYKEGAELLGCILALSVESKNGFSDAELAVQAMVEDVFTRLPVVKELSFASGFSGGSRMSYRLAELETNIAGILACGSGDGVYPRNGDFRSANLPRHTYVYSLVGTNCFNRTGTFEAHESFPEDFRMQYFPGNHDWAGSATITTAMARVVGEGLKIYEGDDAERLCRNFSRTVWEMTQDQQDDAPWEAYRWASFLKEFDGVPTIREQAAGLANALKNHPDVKRAQAAERDMHRLGEDYFDVFYTEDRKPNPERKRDAENMALEYEGLPHQEILRRLGDPCK